MFCSLSRLQAHIDVIVQRQWMYFYTIVIIFSRFEIFQFHCNLSAITTIKMIHLIPKSQSGIEISTSNNQAGEFIESNLKLVVSRIIPNQYWPSINGNSMTHTKYFYWKLSNTNNTGSYYVPTFSNKGSIIILPWKIYLHIHQHRVNS